MTWKTLLLLSLVLLVSTQVYRIVHDSGMLIEIQQVGYGSCQKMFGPPGSEDINIDHINRVAFISAGNGREAFTSYASGKPSDASSGDIWLLDLAVKNSKPVKLNTRLGWPFHPHGIDLLFLPDGGRELYVVNHPTPTEHEVLIFTVNQDHSLALRRQVRYPELISPNDIRAISSDEFFVTNDHGYPRFSLMSTLEDYLGLAHSSVTYFDGEKGSFLLRGIKSANGITLSKDQQSLFVAEALGRSIKRFTRGETIRDWDLVEKLSVPTAVDNLEWSDNGDLLAGAHPNLFDFLAHAADAASLSPSQVISIDTAVEPMTYQTLYMNRGDELSASSVAALSNNEMLIGAVFEEHFLRCSKD